MSSKDFYKQLAQSIADMAKKKEEQMFFPPTQNDYWQQMVEGIKAKQEEIKQLNNPFSKTAIQALVDGMREKIENENREKLNLYHAALDKTKNLICRLYQEIDVYVHAQTVDENMSEINAILDELSPELEKRNELIVLIKKLREPKD